MIAIASDHGGLALKSEVIEYLKKLNLHYEDYGVKDKSPADYPIYARKVVDAIKTGKADRGILICGTGIGVSIAANRHEGIRCALCHDVFTAKTT
jgi:ribose 5-phosphate isomerase B